MKNIAKVFAIPVLAFAMLLPALVTVNASISKKNVSTPTLRAGDSYPSPPPTYPKRHAV